MAYQFEDGFDNFGNGYVYTSGYPWDLAISSPTTSTANVRFPAPAGAVGASLAGGLVRKNLTASQATLIVGVAIYVSNLPTSGYVDLITFLDSGTAQCSLSVNSTGQLQFVRGTSTALIGTQTPNNTFTAGSWHGFLMQITFNSSTGSVVLYLDGNASPAINSSSLNTVTTANNSANQVQLSFAGGTGGGQGTPNYDDFFCWDTTGGSQNAIVVEDSRIITKIPTGAGNYTNWTPNGLGANWQNASQAPPNTSDYNANNVGGTKDSYGLTAIGLQVTPLSVVVRASLEKDDGAAHTPSLMMRTSVSDGSLDTVGTALPALGASYAFYDTLFLNDPNTGVPWTGPNADAAQIGVVEG